MKVHHISSSLPRAVNSIFLDLLLVFVVARISHAALRCELTEKKPTEFHSQNLAVKNVVLRNFKILRNDPETKHIFHLLISFKRNKNVGNFLVRRGLSLTTNQGPSNVNAHDAKLVPLFLT